MIGEVSAFTSPHIIAECIHKVMLLEASQQFGRSRAGLVGWLKKRPHLIQQIRAHQIAALQFRNLPLTIVPLDLPALELATEVSTSHGLLTNDATIVALICRHQITHLVTKDDDFDAIPGLTIWKPR